MLNTYEKIKDTEIEVNLFFNIMIYFFEII